MPETPRRPAPGPAPTAMLFAPPRPPLRLDGRRGIVIGRAPSCDVPVDSARASRSHAAVHGDGERFWIRDLGSTNGTFVNGEKITGKYRLSPGDRIGIGDATVTFCHVEAAMAESVSRGSVDRTMIIGPLPPRSEGLRGSFAHIPPFAVLQMLELGCHTGLLTVEGSSSPGKLWLEGGRPVHAESGAASGFEAAVAVTRTESGTFRFEPNVAAKTHTIESTVTHVLLEASRLSDER
ncbi:MAG: FHA domain-containing protein [Candidatus Eiseniibacteriota bacterium]